MSVETARQGSTMVDHPEPLAVGTFAVFETSGGGFHVTVNIKDHEPRHLEIPALVVRAFMSGAAPGAKEMLRSIRKDKKGVR